jgi:hypothetical protein
LFRRTVVDGVGLVSGEEVKKIFSRKIFSITRNEKFDNLSEKAMGEKNGCQRD